ncbi:signal peptidase I [Candidatus Woesebacteria bacterium RIFCSPLOWO2_01_FULL_39_61]|uniref:Signal peptidase I n=1 Tax=Candidatus Woesebacteria bacterium RIFCSPHIGHO2_02_FULL_39_13 TaxID=1802505 RepID=A0A1F7Z3K2_9BACT|nr:MAG: signal peptidase I [Candidatus Woesebacteria bacterium RIFCSPHIGHO2_01_FULL_39_95]OGM34246.1 MAG: signal peptidase I [Candidatus Woesebacteria bacterium RIFCSPHIGHO2_02_FULL_39_13]OGM38591.1 MAG: signal peptidase I [Candidatus Woesebacteria bacterium RIFCSPHIGHO2_12_FULL_40_20]OGM67076.1 MAG: signal peptidase I [Candidatus Woesebacteria bacterium RIFCSPLOWO2_01_FULL_39_61]OGM71721.1 MAG: signal peptidase I [Candidatus Woesebacteria bacterium RIFCSPLOWO2_12_FULL_39_9]
MYSTIDYLSDEHWLVDRAYVLYKILRPKTKLFLLKLRLLIYSVEYKKYLKRVIKNLPYGLTIIYLGLLSISLLAILNEKSEGMRVITLTSGSMEPVIPVPSLVLTKPVESYKKGDIITYQEISPTTGITFNHTITHRIIEEKKIDEQPIFITKGDANNVPDPQNVTKEAIKGKVILILPYLGYFPLLLKTLPGFLLLIAMPSYFLIKNELKYLAKEFDYYDFEKAVP